MDFLSLVRTLTGARVSIAGVSATGVASVPTDDLAQRLAIDELRVQALSIDTPLPRNGLSAKPASALAPAASQRWDLAPLAGLAGELHVHVTDAAWLLDAEARLPIADGRLDFSRATVSHLGPDSAMGLGRLGLYVDAPTGRQYLATLATDQAPPDGLRFEGQGALALAPLLQAVLAGARPFVPAPGSAQMLRRSRIDGQLHLADGPLGHAGLGLTLSGAAAGRNRVQLSSLPGGGVQWLWPSLSADQLRWRLPQPAGSGTATNALADTQYTVDSLTGSLVVELHPAPGGGHRLSVEASELVLRRLQWKPASA